MNNSLLTLLQVSEKRYYSSIRDDCPGLLVLPSPHALLSIAVECCDVISGILLCCGDIETNPGPDTAALLQTILDGQNEIKADISEMKHKLSNMETVVSHVTELAKRLEESEKELSSLRASMDNMMRKIDDLQNRSRRNNVVIHGIREVPDETYEQLRTSVVSGVFHEKLGVSVASTERIHRIGRPSTERPRPVIVRFGNYNEKVEVLKNTKKLKDTNFSVHEHFSSNVRNRRKNLWKSAADNRKNGQKVALIFDKLKIDGVMYAWNDVTSERYQVHQPLSNASTYARESASTPTRGSAPPSVQD
ncbi:hypothetical protein V5799_034005 [Amblyomma americanum]|uniref:Uncharacterized protein n=1 Tax=Amblyomma americanum TaxID=6943 RepID=A0AAQ4DLP6_AMBAM